MSTETEERAGKTRKIVLLQFVAMVKSGISKRGQHPKPHGVVRATFEVFDNIPTRYKVGLFAKPGRYAAVIRFSNGPQTEDREAGPQGMAIKLIGVPESLKDRVIASRRKIPMSPYLTFPEASRSPRAAMRS